MGYFTFCNKSHCTVIEMNHFSLAKLSYCENRFELILERRAATPQSSSNGRYRFSLLFASQYF